MKKFIVLGLLLIIFAPNSYGWSWRKNSEKQVPTEISEPVEYKEYNNQGKGYAGTLPDLKSNFGAEETKSLPPYEKTKKFNSSDEIKPVPRENPAFVNIMLKTDKTSPYINDINDLLPQLENILLCIEKGYDVQKFNAKVFFFTQSLNYLQEKYSNKPESKLVSFQKIQTLGNHSKSVATLRAEAEKYRPYMAYTGAGYLYNDNVINQQLEYLKKEIEDTIVVIKEAK